MDGIQTLDRDCSALAGLFQLVVNDLKGSSPMWEEFISRASKLHHALKSTVVALSAFLDAFQKIADAATGTRGATKEVGAALTRICLRHRAVESRVKALTSALLDCIVGPLQDKVEEWRRSQNSLDKEHTKEYKKSRTEIKKRTENALRLQKKAKKASKGSDLNKTCQVLESTVVDLRSRYSALEANERSYVRSALIEERSRYCTFSNAFKPVLDEEVGLLSELGHLQEVMVQLEKHSQDPNSLPPASEQVLMDIKGGEAKWSWQTPPSSPGSSLGSRKSSMCSISSINSSGSSSTHSPSHHNRTRSVSQGTQRLVSVSSQDSGFTSQDTLCHPQHQQILANLQGSGLSEQSGGSEGSGGGSPCVTVGGTGTATWPNLTDQAMHKAAPPITDRPHTISTAYEKGRDRPPLTVYTFQPPNAQSGPSSPQICSQPVSPISLDLENGGVSPLAGHTATISRRSSRTSLINNLSSSSQESLNAQGKARPAVPNRCSSLERPAGSLVPEKKNSLKKEANHLAQHSTPKPGYMPAVPDFNQAAPDMIVPQPVYSNMSELQGGVESPNGVSSVGGEVTESDGSSHTSLGSSGYGSQPNMPHDDTNLSDDYDASKYCTLRRYSDQSLSTSQQQQQQLPHLRPGVVVLRRHLSHTGVSSSRNGTLRRSGSHGPKPPPPVRRTPSMTSTKSIPATMNSPVSMSGLNHSASTISLVNHASSLASTASLASSVSSLCASSINGSTITAGSTAEHSPGHISSSENSANGSFLQRTDSESSTPVGSLENLPPPPAFLLEDGPGEGGAICPDPDLTTPEGVRFFGDCTLGPPAPIIDEGLKQRQTSVHDAVKTLQDNKHQPISPLTQRKSLQPEPNNKLVEERRVSLGDARTSIMSTLNAKLAQKIQQTNQQQLQQMPQSPLKPQPPLRAREGSQSPRMGRARLGSLQEGVHLGSPHHQSSHHRPVQSMIISRGSEENIYGMNPLQQQLQQQHQYQQSLPHSIYQQQYSTFSQPNFQALQMQPQLIYEDTQSIYQSGGGMIRSESQQHVKQCGPPPVSKKPNQQAFLQSLNETLSKRQSDNVGSPGSPRTRSKRGHSEGSVVHPTMSLPSGQTLHRSGSNAADKASRVRNWISGKTYNVDPSTVKDSLMEQIRRGTKLKNAQI